MTLEVRPLGDQCNLSCKYCYQSNAREMQMDGTRYNIDKIKKTLEQENTEFSLFGGEALLLPIKDLEDLWSWGYEKYGRNGVQTNGTLITEEHIRLFKKYNVGIGISVDGPGELNDLRWAGSQKKTREMTDKTHKAMALLTNEGVNYSLIITLHKVNALKSKFHTMNCWMRNLDKVGVSSVRLHVLECENDAIRSEYSLTDSQNYDAIINFYNLEKNELSNIRFDLFREIRSLFMGDDTSVSCVWRGCDPYTTPAVRSVERDGSMTNCGRTMKDGFNYVKCDVKSKERSLSLFYTDQEHGGCKGCRFFIVCSGYCPGTGIDGDWRNRTEYCQFLKKIYIKIESEIRDQGITPITVEGIRTPLERELINACANNNDFSICMHMKNKNNNLNKNLPSGWVCGHGDHTDGRSL